MIAQDIPYAFPYSILDFGVATVSLIVIGVLGYVFARLVREQHGKANALLTDMKESLENLTTVTRMMITTLEEAQHEVERTHEEVWRNRNMLENIQTTVHRTEERMFRKSDKGGE